MIHFCILIKENISGYLHIYLIFDKHILCIFRDPLVSWTIFISLLQLRVVSSFVSLKGICNRVHILTIDPQTWLEYWNKCTEPSQNLPVPYFNQYNIRYYSLLWSLHTMFFPDFPICYFVALWFKFLFFISSILSRKNKNWYLSIAVIYNKLVNVWFNVFIVQ